MPASSQPYLSADQLGFTLPDGRVLLRDLTFGVGRERIGLVGANGTGKSTLLRLLTGELPPTHGLIVRRGRIAYLPQQGGGGAHPGPIHPEGSEGEVEPSPLSASSMPTVAHALGVAGAVDALARIEAGSLDPLDFEAAEGQWDVHARVEAELSRFGLEGLDLARPLDSLSGGEATRVVLCGLILDRPDLLLLDEPTNHLDASSREVLYRWAREWQGGLLVISHDRTLLGSMDQILELSGSQMRSYGGNYTLYAAQREAEEQAASRELEAATLALKKAERTARETAERQERRNARAHRGRLEANLPKILLGARRESGERTARRLGESGERRVENERDRVAGARARVELRARLDVQLASSGLQPGRRVLEVRDLVYGYAGASDLILRDLSFSIRGPERLAVTGGNGSGKTTLLRLLAGELKADAGHVEVFLAPGSTAYLDQGAGALDSGATVLECFRRSNPSLDLTRSRHALARYLFPAGVVDARVGSLSGGERIRIALACTVGAERPPQLLLLDEPSNHLDLDSLRAVEDVLRGYDGALVVVSHDAAFLEAVGVDRRLEV